MAIVLKRLATDVMHHLVALKQMIGGDQNGHVLISLITFPS